MNITSSPEGPSVMGTKTEASRSLVPVMFLWPILRSKSVEGVAFSTPTKAASRALIFERKRSMYNTWPRDASGASGLMLKFQHQSLKFSDPTRNGCCKTDSLL